MITPLSLWCLLDGKMLWVWNSLLVFCDEFVKTSSSIPIFSEMKSRCKLSWDNVIPLIGIQHHQQSTGPPVTACLFWWTHVDGYLFWILTVAMISAFLHYKVFSKWIRGRLLYWDTLFYSKPKQYFKTPKRQLKKSKSNTLKPQNVSWKEQYFKTPKRQLKSQREGFVLIVSWNPTNDISKL